MTTTEAYDNGAIPFIRPPRRQRVKRKLKWDQAKNDRYAIADATRKFEIATREWKSRAAKRIRNPKIADPRPNLNDFLPEHLKVSPEAAKEAADRQDALDDGDGLETPADAILGDFPPPPDDDAEVPGLGAAPAKKRAKKNAKPEPEPDDIEIP